MKLLSRLPIPSVARVQALVMRDEQSMMMTALVAMGALAIMMGLVSILVLNSKSTKGYLLNQLQVDQQNLVVETEVTDTLILQAQSLTTIEGAALGMVHPTEDSVSYVLPVKEVAQAE